MWKLKMLIVHNNCMQKTAPKYIKNKFISVLNQYMQCRKLNKWNPVITTLVDVTLHP